MTKIIIFLALTLIAKFSLAQAKAPLAIREYDRGLNPVDEITLFDLSEIKQRKIDTAYIIYHPASWAEYHPTGNPCTCPYSDTLELYVFDTEGRIIQSTSFQQLGDYSTTFHLDTLGNTISRTMYRRNNGKPSSYTVPYNLPDTNYKSVVKRPKVSEDSLITEVSFWRFKNGFDTATIVIKRFNDKGKLIEIQSSVNKRNAREIDDDTGEMTYHFKYEYDSEGRLILYQNVRSDNYKKISYPFYGKLTETYDVKTNQLKYQDIKMINEDKGVITVTFDNKQIILTPLEKGSKLFKLRTIITPGEFPLMEYHEIVYK